LRALIISVGESQEAASKHHRAYWLANFTQGCDWRTYGQVVELDNVVSTLERNYVLLA
jgi:hypothetical protein